MFFSPYLYNNNLLYFSSELYFYISSKPDIYPWFTEEQNTDVLNSTLRASGFNTLDLFLSRKKRKSFDIQKINNFVFSLDLNQTLMNFSKKSNFKNIYHFVKLFNEHNPKNTDFIAKLLEKGNKRDITQFIYFYCFYNVSNNEEQWHNMWKSRQITLLSKIIELNVWKRDHEGFNFDLKYLSQYSDLNFLITDLLQNSKNYIHLKDFQDFIEHELLDFEYDRYIHNGFSETDIKQYHYLSSNIEKLKLL